MYKIAQVVKKIREIGRHCIQERMVAIEKGDEIPQDILSQILRIVRKNFIGWTITSQCNNYNVLQILIRTLTWRNSLMSSSHFILLVS